MSPLLDVSPLDVSCPPPTNFGGRGMDVEIMVPGRFAPNPFPPLDVSPPGRFALGRFAPGRFAPWTFRPQMSMRVVGDIYVEIYVYFELYFALAALNNRSVIVNYINYYLLIIRSCRQRNIGILHTFIKSLII